MDQKLHKRNGQGILRLERKGKLRRLWRLLFLVPMVVLPATAATISPGETKTNAIVRVGQMDSYSFSANAGDTVTILIGASTGQWYPQVELHAPDGSVVKTAYGYSSATIEAQKVTQTGTYLIVCRDENGTGTGNYGLSLVKNPGPNVGDPEGGAIQPGETKTGSIKVGDLDEYDFVANAGDTVTILIGASTGQWYPQVELHAPDGSVVKTAYGYSSATIEAQKVTQTGTYLIVCRDENGTGTGNYGISAIYPRRDAPVIARQPQGVATNVGATVIFSVTATGAAPLTYQWRLNGTEIVDGGRASGVASPQLTITGVQLMEAGGYTVVVSNIFGSVTSAPPATLTFSPSVVVQPPTVITNVGATVIFNVIASGTPPLTYQWFFNGVSMGGTTTTNLTLTNVSTNQSGTYAVVVSNLAGSATASARLTVLVPPQIIVQPQPPSVVTNTGANMTFTVVAIGDQPLNYQWFRKAIGQSKAFPLDGGTNASLTLTSVTPADSGDYLVLVSNPVGIIGSDSASLKVIGCSLHPADTKEPFWRLTIDEVVAYASAWKNSQTWPNPPNSIPMSYMVRAGALWKGGESYTCDPSTTNEPACWVNVQSGQRPASAGGRRLMSIAESTARSEMPFCDVPGTAATVRLTVTPVASVSAYAVEDQPPAGWGVSDVNEGGAFDTVSGKVKWGLFMDGRVRTLTYRLVPRPNAANSAIFVGTANFDGLSEIEIGGQRQIVLQQPKLGASQLMVQPDRTVRIRLDVPVGIRVVVESSADLKHWETVADQVTGTPTLTVQDGGAAAAKSRFYRVKYLPQ